MEVRDDHDRPGLPRDLTCPVCFHLAHAGYCFEDLPSRDLTETVRCPCHCPMPGTH